MENDSVVAKMVKFDFGKSWSVFREIVINLKKTAAENKHGKILVYISKSVIPALIKIGYVGRPCHEGQRKEDAKLMQGPS